MNNPAPRASYIVAAYAVLTAVMTWPQIIRLGSGARDWGDPLLNAWIMWWEVDAVASGNLLGFFDANIFFPHTRALAYSEFLIPQTLVTAPLFLLFDNPLIGYNIALLASFVATAYAMYVLGEYLTGNWYAGFVAGLALAFSPFMFSHLSHIQVIGAAGFPLAFYFLHRYFDERSMRMLVLFSVSYAGQALANAYFGLYLTYAAGAYIVYRWVRDNLLDDVGFYRDMVVHAAISVLLIGPFYVQYWLLRRDLGFTRETNFESGWSSFFAAPPINRLYGAMTAGLRTPEGDLFPGLAVVILAGIGLAASMIPAREGRDAPAPAAVWAYRAFGAFLVIGWTGIVAITLTDGFSTSLLGIEIRANDFQNPVLMIVVSLVARLALRRAHPGVGRGAPWFGEPQRFYAGLLFAGVLLTLGPTGLYGVMYEYAPGFDAVRAVARIHIVSVFCLAVFVAYGVRAVAERTPKDRQAWVAGLIPVVLLMEFFSAPVPLHPVRWNEAPEVYEWLSEQDDDSAVIEYPLNLRLEFDRLFYSPIHRRNLVNGFSGYIAPIYRELQFRQRYFPGVETVGDLRDLGIRWVVFRPDQYGENWEQVLRDLREVEDELVMVEEVGDAFVYEVVGAEPRLRTELEQPPVAIGPDDSWVALDRSSWTLESDYRQDLVSLALDGDTQTRWRAELQEPGQELLIDLGEEATVGRVVMEFGPYPHDYPRGYRVEVSTDEIEWQQVAQDRRMHWPILDFISPLDHQLAIEFDPTPARYVRLTQLGRDPMYVWSITELNIYKPTP